jgi:hypothetical protein
MMTNWKEDLLSEKSLADAYAVSRALNRSKFNWWAYRIALVALAFVGVVWTLKGQHAVSFEAVLQMANTAFDLTVQILGFLIGGFAIFATISDSKLMVRLAKAPMNKTGLSVFKTIFFNFISVFYIYVITLSLAVAVRVSASLHLIDATVLPVKAQVLTVTIINSVVFLVLGAAVVLSILRLKSFIWNIYQAYLTLLIVGEMPEGGPVDGP